jgi:hypothetical protein
MTSSGFLTSVAEQVERSRGAKRRDPTDGDTYAATGAQTMEREKANLSEERAVKDLARAIELEGTWHSRGRNKAWCSSPTCSGTAEAVP